MYPFNHFLWLFQTDVNFITWPYFGWQTSKTYLLLFYVTHLAVTNLDHLHFKYHPINNKKNQSLTGSRSAWRKMKTLKIGLVLVLGLSIVASKPTKKPHPKGRNFYEKLYDTFVRKKYVHSVTNISRTSFLLQTSKSQF